MAARIVPADKKSTKTKHTKPMPVPRNPKLAFCNTGVFTLEEIKRKVEYIWTSQFAVAINHICSATDLTYTVVRKKEKASPKPDRNGVEDEVLGDFDDLLDSALAARNEKAGGAR